MPDGTTTADITGNEEGIFGIGAGDDDMRAASFPERNPPGWEVEIVVVLDTPGTWVFNCWNDVADYPTTAFTVTES